MARLLLVAGVALVLAGCGSNGLFRDRGYDYLRAEAGKPLVYPEGITPIPAQELYPIPDVEQRRRLVPGEDPGTEIPEPPQLVELGQAAPAEAAPATGSVSALAADKVVLTADGNGYPVLMLDAAFDRAWQVVGDALRRIDGVRLEDLDRERAVYFVAVDGKRTAAGDPWQLKLNYTSNGIQVALQVDENAMAPKELSAPLMERLRDGITR